VLPPSGFENCAMDLVEVYEAFLCKRGKPLWVSLSGTICSIHPLACGSHSALTRASGVHRILTSVASRT
jgi:hypothetical protein